MSHSLWLASAGVLVSLSLPVAWSSATPSDATAAASLVSARLIDTGAVDLDGVVHRLGTTPSLRPTAVVFLDVACPVSNRYAPRLNELAAAAEEAGVSFYGVLSDPTVSRKDALAHRAEHELAFPILFDTTGDLALRLKPTHVPEAFVVGTDDSIVYRGRIDDRFAAVGKLRTNWSSHDLLAAIEAVAADGRPAQARTEPVGCVFEAWDAEDALAEVTYTRHIAPILEANCVGCHRAGDIAPFALGSYDEVKRRAKMIALVTEEGTMPPWKADPEWGHFRDARVLSPRQEEVLASWAAAGAPRGDASELAPDAPRSETRWRMGEPDLVVTMPLDFEVPADGDDIYRYFVIPSELTEARTVVGIDFRPGDPSVVHHGLMYGDLSGDGREIDAQTEAPGFSIFGSSADYRGPEPSFLNTAPIAGWAPGNQPYAYPEGTGWKLEPGTDFVLEIHYHPIGKATRDRSALALYFADEPIERHVEGLFIGTERVNIDPGDDAYGRYIYMDVPTDIDLIDVTPHMHYLGRNVEAFATLPDGTFQPLIRIDDWDFRWQDTYVYREPIHLPAGSKIEVLFQYDNSTANPHNPSSPPTQVKEGWQTTDEMCLFYFKVVPKSDADRGKLLRAAFQSFLRPADM